MPVREPQARKGLPDKVGRRAYPARRATLETRDRRALKANKERWERRATRVRWEWKALTAHRVLQVNVDPLAHKAQTVLGWLALKALRVTKVNRDHRARHL